MVSAARAQYLKPMRGFQWNSLALSVNSFALMGRLPMLRSVTFILTFVFYTNVLEGKFVASEAVIRFGKRSMTAKSYRRLE